MPAWRQDVGKSQWGSLFCKRGASGEGLGQARKAPARRKQEAKAREVGGRLQGEEGLDIWLSKAAPPYGAQASSSYWHKKAEVKRFGNWRHPAMNSVAHPYHPCDLSKFHSPSQACLPTDSSFFSFPVKQDQYWLRTFV